MEIIVLGTGCKACKKLYDDVNEFISDRGIDATVTYENDMNKLLEYNVMVVPALVVNGEVVSAGKKLKTKDLEALLINNEKISSCDGDCCFCNCKND